MRYRHCILFLLIFFALPLFSETGLKLMESYDDESLGTLWEKLSYRISVQPLNLLALICFLMAIVHTFVAHRFRRKALANLPLGMSPTIETQTVPQRGHLTKETFFAHLFYFFGEVEVVYGFWCFLLFSVAASWHGVQPVLKYIASYDYNEAFFVAVALATASTYPIMRFADKSLSRLADLGGGTPLAWWVLLLTFGPLLGALLKETVAMTILAVLLTKHFFSCRPSKSLAYATLALLFTNISVAGILTTFASSSIVMVANSWKWNTVYLLQTFGWKVVAGIVVSNGLYFWLFHKELRSLKLLKKELKGQPEVPFWVTAVHLLFLAWIALNSANPIILIPSFILFIGFYQATAPYQVFMNLREPLFVGFFLASLIVLSDMQFWWIEPVVERLDETGLYFASLLISAFTHNSSAALLYSHLPNLNEHVKVLLMSASMAAGGLTIMANGPNIVAYSLLEESFDHEMSFTKLFIAAFLPTLIMSFSFSYFKNMLDKSSRIFTPFRSP